MVVAARSDMVQTQDTCLHAHHHHHHHVLLLLLLLLLYVARHGSHLWLRIDNHRLDDVVLPRLSFSCVVDVVRVVKDRALASKLAVKIRRIWIPVRRLYEAKKNVIM